MAESHREVPEGAAVFPLIPVELGINPLLLAVIQATVFLAGSDENLVEPAAADEIVSGALRRNSPGETGNSATTPFWPCHSKLLKQDSSRVGASIYEIDFRNKETIMRKLFFSIGGIAAAATAETTSTCTSVRRARGA